LITLPPLCMPLPPKDNYWFVLGRESLLAAAELGAVLNLRSYDLRDSILKTSVPFEPRILIKQLGGTVKIAAETACGVSPENLVTTMAETLKGYQGKVVFGISFYNPNSDNKAAAASVKRWGMELKKTLKAGGYPARLVFKDEAVLSSVTVEINDLISKGSEFIVQEENGLYNLAATRAVQPFKEFSSRDYGRPGRDDLSGMLPPKLAMMIINLSMCPREGVLLDPFCGSGTILSEAMLLGYANVIGSDLSPSAIKDTKNNIRWTADNFPVSHPVSDIQIFQSAVERLSSRLKNSSVDSIVTEPYLGKPLRGRETKEDLLRQVHELKRLYINSFKQFYDLLKPQGKIVFIIPRFKYKNEWITIDCLDNIKNIGFKPVPLLPDKISLLYARPDQLIGREIWRFEK